MITRYLAFLGGIFVGLAAFVGLLWAMEKVMWWEWPA